MPTIYFAQNSRDTEDGFEHLACGTANDAKAAARTAYEQDKVPRKVLKVELNKDLGTRELMCALFNGETKRFTGSSTEVAVIGPRKRKSKEEVEEEAEEEASGDEDNPYDI
jgi:hypothetical protein